jgi:Flp pilus assembly protein TadG
MSVRDKRHGQSVVEIMMVLPLLLLMIFGMVDFGLAYTTNIFIRNAVAEGGYYAAQNPGDTAGVRTQIRHELRDMNPPVTDADITITTCAVGSSGPQTEISLDYVYHVIFGLAGSGPTITLHNATTVPQFGGCH